MNQADIKKLNKLKKPFQFMGSGPFSKSLLNRAWVVKSYYPSFEILGSSSCDDVQIIENAVHSFSCG